MQSPEKHVGREHVAHHMYLADLVMGPFSWDAGVRDVRYACQDGNLANVLCSPGEKLCFFCYTQCTDRA